MKILVKSDVYNICKRVKKFDCSYRLVYDTMSKKYQIYSTNLGVAVELVGGVPLSYVCQIPYTELDVRVIGYLRSTSVENIESIIKKIDDENQRVERQEESKIIQRSLEIAENKLRQLT